MGFCLVNNVAVAARYAAETYGFDRIAVVDWDVHHGNGTQEIHWRDSSVLFISLHQWPLYPGTGWLDEIGEGEGTGFNVNLPMPPGSGDREYLEAFDAVVEPIVESYAPQLLLVSAGQDCHAADPLGNQMVSAAGFNEMARRMAAQAQRLGIGLVVCHEGGYNVSTLPQLDHAILAGLGGFDADLEDVFADGAPPAPGWPERLAEIRSSLAAYWPGIGGVGR
jgi:acetoin utilization deacetylase AcuC-like enzyme